MAMGVDCGKVVALIVRGAVVQLTLGVLLGVPLTLAASRFLGSTVTGSGISGQFDLAHAGVAIGVAR